MATVALLVLLTLNNCSPEMVEISDKLAQRGQIYGFTRDAMRKHTLDVCANPTEENIRRWYLLMSRLPLTDAALRAEYRRVIDSTKLKLEGKGDGQRP